MTALELNTGALKLHRDRYDAPTESTFINAALMSATTSQRVTLTASSAAAW